ncbi:squalene epoxidase 3-like [Salvia miltiorrhiza]|uniref:squalene epoxidase 3-like n=1 Tax=Salvia miltiorrhiza TaxID=226208 RepID=UPI0025ABCCA2|nr:squalene epoxidase 3-like [Salvia miltiorrhiza]
MELDMMEQYVVGGFIALVLGLMLLQRLRRGGDKNIKKAAVRDAGVEACSDKVVRGADGPPDVVIVGAGVAGSALAYTLAKDGRVVLVIERDLRQPDRIVGELLQPGGYLKLVELGMEECVSGIDSQQVYGYALYKEGKYAKLTYPLQEYSSDVSGRSFHHGRFIQSLRRKAASLPNVRMEQGTVSSLIEAKGSVKGVKYKNKDGEDVKAFAPLTIVCDGCFSNLRKNLCIPQVNIMSHFVGMVLNLENGKLPQPNHGHVILANPSPVLFYPVSSTEVRCLVDIPGPKLPSISNGDMAHHLKTNVAPQLPPQLRHAFLEQVEKGDIRSMPNRSMPASPLPTPGAILLGDAFNMRHPLTGGGMTVALADVVVLRDLLRPLRDFSDAAALTNHLDSFYTLRKPVASTINTLAGALYQVFCPAADEASREMREACFDYLSLGGMCSQGPIALLSGLNPRPMSLVAHFFAVAVYGVGRLLLPLPSPSRVFLGARLLMTAYGIIFPIVRSEGARQMFFPITIPAYNRGASVVMKSAMFDMMA